ncbi:MAG: septum formation initiator family protein [Prevotellaceae bacterium]|jgi:cell division protein FtsB|nr:septum formation initiator family protein [Prevotellaceae bacterium]
MFKISENRKNKMKRILLNKYAIVLLIFAVIIVFFDDHNVISRIATDRKIRKMETEINYYKKEIESNKQKIGELHSDNENLEKFAREQYLMKKDNEDIFIIE